MCMYDACICGCPHTLPVRSSGDPSAQSEQIQVPDALGNSEMQQRDFLTCKTFVPYSTQAVHLWIWQGVMGLLPHPKDRRAYRLHICICDRGVVGGVRTDHHAAAPRGHPARQDPGRSQRRAAAGEAGAVDGAARLRQVGDNPAAGLMHPMLRYVIIYTCR